MMRKAMPLLCPCLMLPGAAAVHAATPASNHVVVVALENHQYSSIAGSPYMPYLNSHAW